MKKTFQEQLAEAANSLGLNTKLSEKKRSKQRIKVDHKRPVPPETAADGRDKSSADNAEGKPMLTESAPNLMTSTGTWLVDKKKIRTSPLEEFARLADLALRFPEECSTRDFKHSLRWAAAWASLAIQYAPEIFEEEDTASFKSTFKKLKHWISEEDYRWTRQQLELVNKRYFKLLAKKKLEHSQKLTERLTNFRVKSRFTAPDLNKRDLELAISWYFILRCC